MEEIPSRHQGELGKARAGVRGVVVRNPESEKCHHGSNIPSKHSPESSHVDNRTNMGSASQNSSQSNVGEAANDGPARGHRGHDAVLGVSVLAGSAPHGENASGRSLLESSL